MEIRSIHVAWAHNLLVESSYDARELVVRNFQIKTATD